MAGVVLHFSGELSKSDPAQHAVLIVGQIHHLLKLSYEKLKVKLEPRVSEEVGLTQFLKIKFPSLCWIF